jgi:DDE superfamily endonuclease
MVDAVACLALTTLAWYMFRGAGFVLVQSWLGFSSTQCNVWLRFGRKMLLKTLLRRKEAQVRFPSAERIKFLASQVKQQYKTLDNVYCVADGLKLPFEACSGLTKQNMYYNGWQNGHNITNLFVFSVDGRIIHCVVNVPSSVHDSQVAIWGRTYEKLKQIHSQTGGICCVDSTFAAGKAEYLIRSSDDTTKAKNKRDLLQMKEATSLRQGAE